MKAIEYVTGSTVQDARALRLADLPDPVLRPRDLLVRVEAVSVNPVDVKLRAAGAPSDGPAVLGYDAAGTVQAVGPAVTLFQPGDQVFYAGDVTRTGTNATLHAVDERIVGPKPAGLSMAEAAALPLTAITAWEILFDSFALSEGAGAGAGEALLVIGGAGGVGSILIQLAKQLTGLIVIATASRPQTIDWVQAMGADHVIDHHGSLPDQMAALGIQPRHVAALTASDRHLGSIVDLIRPRGAIAMIDDPGQVDISALKPKALSLHWEFMFTRSMFETADMDVQHALLTRVAQLVDQGRIRTTMTQDFGPLSPESLLRAHALQESGRAIGKSVLTGIA